MSFVFIDVRPLYIRFAHGYGKMTVTNFGMMRPCFTGYPFQGKYSYLPHDPSGVATTRAAGETPKAAKLYLPTSSSPRHVDFFIFFCLFVVF